MGNIIKVDIYRLLKNKMYYIICGLLGAYLLVQIYLNFFIKYPGRFANTGLAELRIMLSALPIIALLFSILAGKFVLEEYETGTIKNIFGRGISRKKYFLGKIISVYGVTIVTWAIFLVLQTEIFGLKSGMGKLDSGTTLILNIVLNMTYILALIIISIAATTITRNGIFVVIIWVLTLNIFKLIIIGLSFFNINAVTLRWFDMSLYVSLIYSNVGNIVFLKGILTTIVYIIVAIIIGMYAIKKQDVK